MDVTVQQHLTDLHSGDSDRRNDAYAALMAATERPVGWAYDVWDDLVASLHDRDNHVRSIASQVLCNLAKSDPDDRMADTFPALLRVTHDERFVTARHGLQSLWKIGVAGPTQRRMLLDGLTHRFEAASAEKNGTLVRFDIAQGLRTLYDTVQDETVKVTALALIDAEADPKYRKKYAAVWRGV